MKIEILENRSCSKGEETEDERSRDRNIDDRKEEEEMSQKILKKGDFKEEGLEKNQTSKKEENIEEREKYK